MRLPGWIPIITGFLVGAGLTVWGVVASPPTTWQPFVILGCGLLMAAASFVGFLFKFELARTERAVSIKLDQLHGQLFARMNWRWLIQQGDNWRSALELVDRSEREGVECYETSSIENDDRYENRIRGLSTHWRRNELLERQHLTRIFCFNDRSDEKQDVDCRTLFHAILDASKDPEGLYDDLRECIRTGTIAILHLPFRLMTDYLAIRTTNGQFDCLFSLAPPTNRGFLASARVSDAVAGKLLFDHLRHIASLADAHCMKNAGSQVDDVACSRYSFDEQRRTLIPFGDGH